ncbi:MAG: YgiT-type zinc finger protein [Butyrivibrio sp.]|nr:YgiT-type zinc finger protein [Acetatifactor muris]MCM1558741.1 YgiT-type zinc finger protein [Butyrivibrio sp.]
MCMYCKGTTTVPSLTTHVVNYKNCIIIIKNVPCMAKQLMQEIAIIDYSKAA